MSANLLGNVVIVFIQLCIYSCLPMDVLGNNGMPLYSYALVSRQIRFIRSLSHPFPPCSSLLLNIIFTCQWIVINLHHFHRYTRLPHLCFLYFTSTLSLFHILPHCTATSTQLTRLSNAYSFTIYLSYNIGPLVF